MTYKELINNARETWPNDIEVEFEPISNTTNISCRREIITKICDWLFNKQYYHFTGLVVEENTNQWDLFYLFTADEETGFVQVKTFAPLEERTFPSISLVIHAADWHEREAAHLFGLLFKGHPHLEDFGLHDVCWEEDIKPMQKKFKANDKAAGGKTKQDWQPQRVVKAAGAFIMPIGPVFSGVEESVQFQLETIGEEIIWSIPTLFYKYRGVEKIAEGQTVDDVLLLAERFAGTTAFAHAFAFCRAVEQVCNIEVPERAMALRVFLAELERFQHHICVIEGICNSTGLVVAANQAAILEEDAQRIRSDIGSHRYFFGLAVPGGLSRDIDDRACKETVARVKDIADRLHKLQKLLITSNSFLDRIEEIGVVNKDQAHSYGLAGPVARGSGYCNDLRKKQPYSGYDRYNFEVPCELEGDGYSRLRIFFAEANQSVYIMEQAAETLPAGNVFTSCDLKAGTAVAGVEAPRGGAWHWVEIDKEQKIARYRIIPPSFANWHGLHLAVDNFAFQDFPIILATFGLSAAENDR